MPVILLFDFGGTLDGDGEPWAVRFHRAYRECGGTLAQEPFEACFRRTDAVLTDLPGIRRMGLREMIERQARLLADLVADGGALNTREMADRFHATTLAGVARNRPMLARLAGRHRLGIVSNFSGNLDRCLTELAVGQFFDVVCDSTVIGWAKPDQRIFLCALDALGGTPREAWMIGDNFEADIRPAARLGLHTCWIAPEHRPLPVPGVATIRLAALPAFLGHVA